MYDDNPIPSGTQRPADRKVALFRLKRRLTARVQSVRGTLVLGLEPASLWARRNVLPVLRAMIGGYSAVRRSGAAGILSVGVPVMFVVAVFWLMIATAPKPGSLAMAAPGSTPPLQLEYILNATDTDTGVPPETGQAVEMPKVSIPETLHIITYTVKAGDTLSQIAQDYGVSDETIISFNGIADARFIQPGMKLEIPTLDGILYRVRPGDTLKGIAVSHKVKLQSIIDVNHLTNNIILPNQELFLPGGHMNTYAYRVAIGTLFIWPTHGVITSPFGMRRDPFTGTMEFHAGVDIANSIGTPVVAAADGWVIGVGFDHGYGRYILLNNGGGYHSLYAHLYVQLVSPGQWVRSGQEIGRMGDTGFSTGPHLHFAIFKNEVPVNPLIYLP